MVKISPMIALPVCYRSDSDSELEPAIIIRVYSDVSVAVLRMNGTVKDYVYVVQPDTPSELRPAGNYCEFPESVLRDAAMLKTVDDLAAEVSVIKGTIDVMLKRLDAIERPNVVDNVAAPEPAEPSPESPDAPPVPVVEVPVPAADPAA